MEALKSLLPFFFLLLGFLGNAQQLLKNFYYSFGETKETKIYKFVDQNNTSEIFYWVMTLDPANQSIRTDAYNKDFVKEDSFYEVLGKRGAKLKEYSVFGKNFFGFLKEYKAKVLQNKVYAWNEKNPKTYFYEVEYVDQYGKTKFVKSRIFQRIDTISVQGKEYKAAKFEDHYQIDLIDKDDSYGFVQFSYYAEGLGLVKYRSYVSGAVINAELVAILSETEFEKLKKSRK
jgi:hypothetical protein